ncbi:MAG TPA: hypothetical protein DDY13_16290 [Cytophagales bacterium]|jgi:hypothetical protein|nr:hypothetical protein [Cytophagales bacterium]
MALNKADKAIVHYQALIALKDSLNNKSIENIEDRYNNQFSLKMNSLIIERTEEMLIEEDMKEMKLRQLQLEADRNEKNLALLEREKELQTAQLNNEKLMKDKAIQEKQIVQQQMEAQNNEQRIKLLEKEQYINQMELEQQALREQEKIRPSNYLKRKMPLTNWKSHVQKVPDCSINGYLC